MKKLLVALMIIGLTSAGNLKANKNWQNVYIDTTTGSGINVHQAGEYFNIAD